uniref:Protein kinase domain-containing protein n=1 Tax=Rhizophagus irregularis (strain DAOM 181602 / DAOM 197198 / MUCL 43194) TaxID=747089 RepID=U9UAU4_RHIID
MSSENKVIEYSQYSKYSKSGFVTYTSGNKKIDNFIQERQLKIKDHDDVVFEWIPYNQFDQVKKICKNSFVAVYSAIWGDGPLYYQHDKYIRDSNKEVTLKFLNDSQIFTEFVIYEAKKYSTKNNKFFVLYGISQNSGSNDYILVQNNYINFTNWKSGNEKIDDYIQKRRLEIKGNNDVVFEWIPYNQFDQIKEEGKSDFMTVYSAIWRDGPLFYKLFDDDVVVINYTRDSNKEVALKFLHNSLNSIEYVINEVKKYSTKNDEFLVLYGISQNPDTNDYILVQNNYINFTNWKSGNEKIDDYIQKRRLEIKGNNDVVFEWIPYNRFNKIIETGKSSFMTVYSAIWDDGPLSYKLLDDDVDNNYTRDSNKEVALKFLHNSQNSIEFVINEV